MMAHRRTIGMVVAAVVAVLLCASGILTARHLGAQQQAALDEEAIVFARNWVNVLLTADEFTIEDNIAAMLKRADPASRDTVEEAILDHLDLSQRGGDQPRLVVSSSGIMPAGADPEHTGDVRILVTTRMDGTIEFGPILWVDIIVAERPSVTAMGQL